MTRDNWQIIAEKKQIEASNKIPTSWRLSAEFVDRVSPRSSKGVMDVPRTCGILTDMEIDITENYDAIALLSKLASKEFSAYEVATAFCKRAAIAQQLTCCLTETFFDEALARAKYLDEYFDREGKPLGPFHGLPISLKDSFNVKGVPSTLGFVSFIDNKPPTSNSALVEILLSLGAVLYVKTNIPQTLMTPDSHNNVFGRVLNPYKLCLTAGGSSGGEGALIAMRGSILGIGTDIGGSIRVPSLCCGTFGFRPSTGRIPFGGQMPVGRLGKVGIVPVAGPLATSLRDIRFFMKKVLDSDPWTLDETASSAPWRQVSAKRALRVGLLLEDPDLPLHPPVLRTLKTAAKKLKAAGHTVVSLDGKILAVEATWQLTSEFFSMDPSKTVMGHINRSGEPLVPSVRLRAVPELANYKPSLEKLYDANILRRQYQAAFRRLIVENKLDVLMMPGNAATAVPHDTYGSTAYTRLVSLLDYPACIIPHGKASKAKDEPYLRDVNYRPPYDAEVVEGAPCAIQIVGRNMRDEELIRDAQTIADALAV